MKTLFLAASAALVSFLAACDFSYGESYDDYDYACHENPGGYNSRTELAIDADLSVEGRSVHLMSNDTRIDDPPFHLRVLERTIEVYYDAPGGAAVDAGEMDAGELDGGADAATWTAPGPGDPRLIAAIQLPPLVTGTWDLATSAGWATVCHTGTLLDDVSGYFCGEREGVRSADRETLLGSIDVHVESGRQAYTIDTHVDSAHLALRLAFDQTTITTEYPPSQTCH